MKITKKLGEVASIQAGHPMRGTVPEVPGSGVFMVQPKDIDPFGRSDWSQVTETALRGRLEPRWLEPGDLIFRMNGKTNLASYIDRMEMPGVVVCHHQFFHLRVEVEGLAPEFLAWFINLESTQQALSSLKKVAGTGPVVNKGMLSGLAIQYPGIDSQSRALTAWSEYLSKLRLLEAEKVVLRRQYAEAISDIASC